MALKADTIGKFALLDPESLPAALRLLGLISNSKGFYDAYTAFLGATGGLEAVGLKGVVRFMDAWEAAHE